VVGALGSELAELRQQSAKDEARVRELLLDVASESARALAAETALSGSRAREAALQWHLSNAPQAALGARRILARTDKPSFVDTNLRLDEWVLQPFQEILREKASGQQRDPKFSDTKWTRQTTGQARLEASLVLYEKHLASLTFPLAWRAGRQAAARRRRTTAP
jgi:hypothetical protein